MNHKRLRPELLPYDVSEFAARHSISEKVALAILCANTSSKRQADIGAEVLKRAKALRVEKGRVFGVVTYA